MNTKIIMRKFNYSLVMNFLFILFIIILINFSGKTDIEIIDDFLQYQDEHGPIPAVELVGDFNVQKDTAFEFPEDIIDENIYVQRVISFVSPSVYPEENTNITYFVDDQIWTSLIDNNEIKVLYVKSDNYNISEITQIKLPFINQTIEIQENEISFANALPAFLTNSISFGTTGFIIPQSIIDDKILVTTQNFNLAEFLYFKSDYLQSVNKIKDIEIQTLNIVSDQLLHLSELDELVVGIQYTPFLSRLQRWEINSYADLGAILYSSSVKIIFLEIIIILGYHILLLNKFRFIQLQYFRGNSIKVIKKKLIINEIKNIGIVSILSSATILSLQWTDFQQQFFVQLIVPWLILYLIYSFYVINYNIRKFKERIASDSVLKIQKKKTTYKLFGIISFALGLLALINLLTYSESIFHSFFLVYLYWSLTFLIIFIFIFAIEREFLNNQVSKFSSSKLILPKIRKNRFILLLLIFMIAGNTYINQEINLDLVNKENQALIKGNMGDFTIRNGVSYEDIFNNSKLNEIEKIQSALPVYRIDTTLFDENSIIASTNSFLYLAARLVNQSLYDSFTSKDISDINKEKFFEDKIWVPINYLGPFKYRSNVNLNIAGKFYPLKSDDFNVLEDKSGIMGGGLNSILSSIETWDRLNLPFEDLELDSIILSFVDNIDIETAKIRVANAFNKNADDKQLRLIENEITVKENDLENTLSINQKLNVLFSLAIGFTFFYFLIDEKIFNSLLYYLTKYGVNKSKRLFTEIILLSSFIGLVSLFIGSFSSFVGSTGSIIYFKILYFEWANIYNLALYLLLPQIGAQILYSLYLTRKIKNIVDK